MAEIGAQFLHGARNANPSVIRSSQAHGIGVGSGIVTHGLTPFAPFVNIAQLKCPCIGYKLGVPLSVCLAGFLGVVLGLGLGQGLDVESGRTYEDE